MPNNNAHPFHIHIPSELWKQFQKIAKANRRKLKEEALIAIEDHIKANTKRKDT